MSTHPMYVEFDFDIPLRTIPSRRHKCANAECGTFTRAENLTLCDVCQRKHIHTMPLELGRQVYRRPRVDRGKRSILVSDEMPRRYETFFRRHTPMCSNPACAMVMDRKSKYAYCSTNCEGK